MRISDDAAFHQGFPAGDYFFARGPLPGVVEVLEPRIIAYWAAAFDRWITETMQILARHKAGTPLPTDPPARRMQIHLSKLQSEARSGMRSRLFRR